MECPICGKDCEDLKIEFVEVYSAPMEDMADYLFNELVKRGYAANFDDVNMILDLVHNYMIENGDAYNDDEEECS